MTKIQSFLLDSDMSLTSDDEVNEDHKHLVDI